MRKKIILFISYLRTVIAFYVFGRFRNMNHEQINFLEKSFKPTCKRDERLVKKMLDFNKNQLKNAKQ
jgi:polyhydroxyalkanoate synthesis regulator protein